MAIEINIKDFATPSLRKLRGRLQTMGPVIGRTAVNLFRGHFFKRDKTNANKMGGRRTHFWGTAAGATHFRNHGADIMLEVSQLGVRQRYFGGEIRPRNKKWLTIPVHPEAYGKGATEFNNLRAVFPSGKNYGLLIKASEVKRRGRGQRQEVGRAMYLLVKKVNQRADKTVIPSNQAIGSTIVEAIKTRIKQP